jgi:hypothetical protein
MAIVVVGGHTRNIGKTSVVCGILAALPQYHWTAFKITQYGHGVCSANGGPCDCATSAHTAAVTEEHDAAGGTDTARFLQAGAVRSFWVRTRQGHLAEAMPRLRAVLAEAPNAILESNSILHFLRPDLYLAVLDARVADFKPSAQYFLDRADALLRVVPPNANGPQRWPDQAPARAQRRPQIFLHPPEFAPPALVRFLQQRLSHCQEGPFFGAPQHRA